MYTSEILDVISRFPLLEKACLGVFGIDKVHELKFFLRTPGLYLTPRLVTWLGHIGSLLYFWIVPLM